MKVTDDEIKYRQLHIEGCLQKVPAEQGEYAGAYGSSRITENNITDTNLLEDTLLEKIRENQIPGIRVLCIQGRDKIQSASKSYKENEIQS
ncbi:MAG: hypothetical protein ACQEP4_05085 [Bacillota bacterium]